jgi:hypothetical protein
VILPFEIGDFGRGVSMLIYTASMPIKFKARSEATSSSIFLLGRFLDAPFRQL